MNAMSELCGGRATHEHAPRLGDELLESTAFRLTFRHPAFVFLKAQRKATAMVTHIEPAFEATENLIEIRVNDIAQLFHTLDPFPFREKDLANEAEEYIVSWAQEMPANRPIKIAIHIPAGQSQIMASTELVEAFNRYFAGRAVAIQHDLNELFRVGRRSLAIGASILASCLLLAHLAAGYVSKTRRSRN